MAKRYNHYLRPAKSNTWPERIICVDCVPVVAEHSGRLVSRTETLASWSAVSLLRQGDEYRIGRTMYGADCATWWKEIAHQLRYSGVLWIVSVECGRIWTLLGLWEGIENGTVTLAARDARTEDDTVRQVQQVRSSMPDSLAPYSSGALQRVQERSKGYLVLEDPPCIARLRIGAAPGWLQWIDTRNFGAGAPEEATYGHKRASWLANWMKRTTVALNTYHMGSLNVTTASQAYTGFRHHYYTGGIYCHNDVPALAHEGRSYCGGRCECFQIGDIEHPLWHFDFRAQYGALMSQHSLPARLRDHTVYPSGTVAIPDVDVSRCIARVSLTTDEPAYARKDRSDTIVPVGRFISTLCGPELCDAIQHHRVVAWHEATTYHMEPCLKSYADAIYQMRQDYDKCGDREMSALAKGLLVSLAGKLGQRDRRWLNCPECAADRAYGEWIGADPRGEPCRYRSIGYTVHRDTDCGIGADACPAMAAWITSAARMALLSAIRTAGWDHVYYVDTDALMVDETGANRLRHGGMVRPGVFGGLQEKHARATVTIRGIKHYIVNGELTCAGLPRGLCADAGDGIHYWYHDYPAHQIALGHRPEAKRILRKYHRDAPYHHGTVADDGRVSPIRLQEW